MSTADSAWLLISTALVLFMVPGLALFYGGLVTEKNVIAMMTQSFVAIGIVSVLWVVIGYSLVFGADHNGLIGGLDQVMLHGVGASPSRWNTHVPGLLFTAYQAMFAVITPALIAGAHSGRMHFRGYLAFIALWSLVIYCPFAHWVWGGGFLGSSGLGAVDFAGGAVVLETGRRVRVGDRALPRTTARRGSPSQRPARAPRREHPLVRLVRVPCGQRRQRWIRRDLRTGEHPAGRGRRDGGLDVLLTGVLATLAVNSAGSNTDSRSSAGKRRSWRLASGIRSS